MTILSELLVASAMVTLTIVIHLAGLAGLLAAMRRHRAVTSRTNQMLHAGSGMARQSPLVVFSCCSGAKSNQIDQG